MAIDNVIVTCENGIQRASPNFRFWVWTQITWPRVKRKGVTTHFAATHFVRKSARTPASTIPTITSSGPVSCRGHRVTDGAAAGPEADYEFAFRTRPTSIMIGTLLAAGRTLAEAGEVIE